MEVDVKGEAGSQSSGIHSDPAELDHHRAQSAVDNPNGRDSVLCEVTENHYS